MASYTGSSYDSSRIHKLQEERKKKQEELESYRHGQDKRFNGRLIAPGTVGLVTFDDFRARREYLEKCAVAEEERRDAVRRANELERNKGRVRRANTSRLSFGDLVEEGDQEVEETKYRTNGIALLQTFEKNEIAAGEQFTSGSGSDTAGLNKTCKRRRKIGMDPGVDTSFLPDKDREQEERLERERLKQQWLEEQERIKQEDFNINYSVWDGKGQKKTHCCKKGTTIGKFLARVQMQVASFRHIGVEDLMFVKEDMIIPHHISFYDLISTKIVGKCGPLFHFNVYESVRLQNDATPGEEDSHAAKVVERGWYEKNKHTFPASRWEIYDPSKTYKSTPFDDNRSWYEFGVFLPELVWRRITGAPPPERRHVNRRKRRKAEGLTKIEIRIACPEGLRFETKVEKKGETQKSHNCKGFGKAENEFFLKNSKQGVLNSEKHLSFEPGTTTEQTLEHATSERDFIIDAELYEIEPAVEEESKDVIEKRNSSKDSTRSTRTSDALSLVHVPASPAHIFQFIIPQRWVTHETDSSEPYHVAEKEGVVLGSFYIPDEMCAVCLDPVMPGVKLRVLQCRHAFHSPCIEQWLRGVNRCPLCNTPPIPVYEKEDLEDGDWEFLLRERVGENSQETYWKSSAYLSVLKSYNARCWVHEVERE
eukprot:jgi/Galph1/5532/GphlegSOOS_G4172.1